MMAYSKSLQHSLSNTASSHCAHNLVLQVKGTAPKQAGLSSSCNIVSACDISDNIASDISNSRSDSSLHCEYSGEIDVAANGIISNLTWASCETHNRPQVMPLQHQQAHQGK